MGARSSVIRWMQNRTLEVGQTPYQRTDEENGALAAQNSPPPPHLWPTLAVAAACVASGTTASMASIPAMSSFPFPFRCRWIQRPPAASLDATTTSPCPWAGGQAAVLAAPADETYGRSATLRDPRAVKISTSPSGRTPTATLLPVVPAAAAPCACPRRIWYNGCSVSPIACLR